MQPAALFTHARRITWGETDAARIAYTPRFLDYAVEAVEHWFRERLGTGWYEMAVDRGIGTPFVRVEIDFRSPVTPRDMLVSTVRLARLGGSSLRFAVTGRAGDRLVYEAALACAFVAMARMQPVAAPAELRAALEAEAALGAAFGA